MRARSLGVRPGVVCLLSLLSGVAIGLPACGGEDGSTSAGGSGGSKDGSVETGMDASVDVSTDTPSDSGEGGPTQCEPKTCPQIGADCGSAPDGCGGTIECGECPAGQSCGGGGVNKCGIEECVPRSCVQLGAQCGWASDGCADAIYCGECAPPELCGWGGDPNACGTADVCGDGAITGSEVCDTDGPNVGGETCVSQGYAGGGTLGCASGCMGFDYAACEDSPLDCDGMRVYDWTDLDDGTISTNYFSDHHWGLNVEHDPDSISVTSATNRLREPNTKSLRFYINPTDPPPPSSSSHDGNLRAEIYESYEFTTGDTVGWAPDKPLKTEEWLGWSYYFPDDFKAGDTASTKFLQCHVGTGAAPIDLRHWNPLEYPDYPSSKCPGDECDEFVLVRLWPDDSNGNQESLVTDYKPTAGSWMDFVLHVVWDTDSGGDGITEFWINGDHYPGTPGGNTFDAPENKDHPYGGMIKLGMYHGSWRYADSIQASLDEGVDHLEIFMGPVRILSRLQGDHIGAQGYDCVASRGSRP